MLAYPLIQLASAHAQSGRFPEMLALCQEVVDAHAGEVDALLGVGALLQSFGYLSRARVCLEQVRALAPNDLRCIVNLANLAREAGDHAQAQQAYTALQVALPHNPVIRRNALTSQEYDPAVTDAQRWQQACDWGEWAITQAGGPRAQPLRSARPAQEGRPLRIGYVSADVCQHTVGLFVKDVIQAHDRSRCTVFVYSAGLVDDWVTAEVRAACTLRAVAGLDDEALAALIRQNEVDVLIDLSGHTAGSRLTVFAHRPAPVQVSWLGYFATTGLRYMDAVLLDVWHAPAGTEAQFIEPIIRLPQGRWREIREKLGSESN